MPQKTYAFEPGFPNDTLKVSVSLFDMLENPLFAVSNARPCLMRRLTYLTPRGMCFDQA